MFRFLALSRATLLARLDTEPAPAPALAAALAPITDPQWAMLKGYLQYLSQTYGNETYQIPFVHELTNEQISATIQVGRWNCSGARLARAGVQACSRAGGQGGCSDCLKEGGVWARLLLLFRHYLYIPNPVNATKSAVQAETTRWLAVAAPKPEKLLVYTLLPMAVRIMMDSVTGAFMGPVSGAAALGKHAAACM